jgi:hypothetical protein
LPEGEEKEGERTMSDIDCLIIKIGQYRITTHLGPGRLWIQREDGEGMEVSEKDFEKIIDRFWDEKF